MGFIWTVPLAILLGGWGALRTQKVAIAPEGQIQKAGSIPDPVTIQAEVVAVNKGTEPPKGSKFDPTTGAPIPKFDPETASRTGNARASARMAVWGGIAMRRGNKTRGGFSHKQRERTFVAP